jgi:hypothetical protein
VRSDRLTVAAAQLALAREYGFASWPRLKREVERLRRGRRDPRTDYVVVTEGLVGWAARADGPSGTLQVA